MKVLVVAAHPDDEVLGCGGTIAHLAQAGHEVEIAILGEGITSRYEEREQADAKLLEALHGRAREVGKMLGAAKVSLFSLPDNRFDTVPLLKVIKIVESLVERIQPHTIYTHHAGDLNIDHEIVNRAVLTATRPMASSPVRDIYAFEVASSTEWTFHQRSPVFAANVFVDIAATVELKAQAMSHYEMEARAFPHPRSSEAIHATAQRWGTVAGLPAAEAFELVRSIRKMEKD